jgi:hypothetical protein
MPPLHRGIALRGCILITHQMLLQCCPGVAPRYFGAAIWSKRWILAPTIVDATSCCVAQVTNP